MCTTCNSIANSKIIHCSRCNVCFDGMDHHCVWVNKCIADGNIKEFYAFLASAVFLFVYCAVMSITAVRR